MLYFFLDYNSYKVILLALRILISTVYIIALLRYYLIIILINTILNIQSFPQSNTFDYAIFGDTTLNN